MSHWLTRRLLPTIELYLVHTTRRIIDQDWFWRWPYFSSTLEKPHEATAQVSKFCHGTLLWLPPSSPLTVKQTLRLLHLSLLLSRLSIVSSAALIARDEHCHRARQPELIASTSRHHHVTRHRIGTRHRIRASTSLEPLAHTTRRYSPIQLSSDSNTQKTDNPCGVVRPRAMSGSDSREYVSDIDQQCCVATNSGFPACTSGAYWSWRYFRTLFGVGMRLWFRNPGRPFCYPIVVSKKLDCASAGGPARIFPVAGF